MSHTKEPDDFCTLCLKRKSSKPNCSKCNPQQRITDLERQIVALLDKPGQFVHKSDIRKALAATSGEGKV